MKQTGSNSSSARFPAILAKAFQASEISDSWSPLGRGSSSDTWISSNPSTAPIEPISSTPGIEVSSTLTLHIVYFQMEGVELKRRVFHLHRLPSREAPTRLFYKVRAFLMEILQLLMNRLISTHQHQIFEKSKLKLLDLY